MESTSLPVLPNHVQTVFAMFDMTRTGVIDASYPTPPHCSLLVLLAAFKLLRLVFVRLQTVPASAPCSHRALTLTVWLVM